MSLTYCKNKRDLGELHSVLCGYVRQSFQLGLFAYDQINVIETSHL